MNNDSIPFSIRLKLNQKEKLEQLAKAKGLTTSNLIRHLIGNGLSQFEKSSLSIVEEASTKAISEMLYMMRAMADRLDPILKDAAKAHALEVMEKIKQHYE